MGILKIILAKINFRKSQAKGQRPKSILNKFRPKRPKAKKQVKIAFWPNSYIISYTLVRSHNSKTVLSSSKAALKTNSHEKVNQEIDYVIMPYYCTYSAYSAPTSYNNKTLVVSALPKQSISLRAACGLQASSLLRRSKNSLNLCGPLRAARRSRNLD